MTAEEIWRRKSDEDLQAAAERLEEFTEEGQRIIKAELERRSTPEYLIEQEALDRSKKQAEIRPWTPARPVQTETTSWLVRRVVLAIALMAGFYFFAVLIVIALLSIPFAEWMVLNHVDFRIAIACIGAACAVLWALVPRSDTFTPPGPALDASSSPRLFRVIRDVAAATRQIEPAEVYLLGEVNAWVTHRGGTMGFGSRRVMGIGLPLLQALSVSEFTAIVAHEFGHYSGGDVKLGPWVYKTRAAIVRTIVGVHGTFVEAPFQWYGRQFLKLTHAVSRQQEFIADRVAARITGASHLTNALRRVTALTPAYSAYVNGEVLPVLQAGFLPPIGVGFDEFLQAGGVAEASRRFVDVMEGEGRTDVFDTHPSLRDRLAALAEIDDVSRSEIAPERASVLIDDVEAHARALVEFAFGPDAIRNLKPIDWSLVGASVFATRWRAIAKSQSKWLGRHTADAIPCGTHAFIQLGSGLVRSDEMSVSSEERIARAVYVLAVAIGIVLLDQGWSAQTRLGMPVQFFRGSETFEPMTAVRALAEGKTTAEAWRTMCDGLGIAGVRLGTGREGPRAPVVITRLPVTVAKVAPKAAERNEINCWQCKQALPVTNENRGKTIKCPHCGTKQELPR